MSSLTCAEYQACDAKTSSEATFYCLQCNSLQCASCEQGIHRNTERKNHERLTLDEMDNESCSVNNSHAAIFYCPTCARTFCYLCYVKQHQQSDGRKHKPQKFREGQVQSTATNTVGNRGSAKPLYPDLPKSANKTNKYANPSAPFLEDVELGKDDKHAAGQSKLSNPANTHHDDEYMFDENREGSASDTDSNGIVLLLNATEQLSVRNPFEFIRQLKSSAKDPAVKCVSIIGNTGDGKSYTLNQVFFDGQEKFNTSAKSDSCTVGAWAALDQSQRTLVVDTEGRLGLSQNDNTRNRLLLKIMCVSDVVIYRTKAPRLSNDMFQFLSDASTAFLKYFKKELENVMRSCKVEGPMSAMGPTLVVFHETEHTEVLKDQFQCQKTAVEQLKERFDQMNLPYDAYSSIDYVGIQTLGGKKTDFSEIKATVNALLENNKIRSPRRLSVIFKALKALNEKFNHAIPPDMPSTLPDDFFTCFVHCLSCGSKCHETANHQKDGIPHQCHEQCSYNKELDNEIMKCVQCDREGNSTIVYGKLVATNDHLVGGFLKYVWSGSVIECPKHGEIYRSRKYWHGNTEPKSETRVEIIHVWPGNDANRLSSDVTPRKVVEAICTATSYVSGPTKKLSEIVADYIAPEYWVSNRDSDICSQCKLQFGLEYSKHHCRACGYTFCDTCTKHRVTVPLLDSQTPERVCDSCYQHIQSQTLSSIIQNNNSLSQGEQMSEYGNNDNTTQGSYVPNTYNIPMSRRILDIWKNNVAPMIYTYPIEFIKAGTQPRYWRPDNECLACFICKHPFNSTTHRLHHCRKCGEGVCDTCSPNRHPVPERGWAAPERVCTLCEAIINESKDEQN